MRLAIGKSFQSTGAKGRRSVSFRWFSSILPAKEMVKSSLRASKSPVTSHLCEVWNGRYRRISMVRVCHTINSLLCAVLLSMMGDSFSWSSRLHRSGEAISVLVQKSG